MKKRISRRTAKRITVAILVFAILIFIAAPTYAVERDFTAKEKELVDAAIKFLEDNGSDSIGGTEAAKELKDMLGEDSPDGKKKIRRETEWELGDAAADGSTISVGLPEEDEINSDPDTPEGFTQVKTLAQTLVHEWVHHRRFGEHGRDLVPALDSNWAACQPLWDEVEAYYREIKLKLTWKVNRENELAEIPGYGPIAGPPTAEQQARAEQLQREITDLEEQIDEAAGTVYLAAKRQVSEGSALRKSYEEGGTLISEEFKEKETNQAKLDEVTARLNDISKILEGEAQISIEQKITNKVAAYRLQQTLNRILEMISRFSGGIISLELECGSYFELVLEPGGILLPEPEMEAVEIELIQLEPEFMIPWAMLGYEGFSPVYQVRAPIDVTAVEAIPATITMSFDLGAVGDNFPGIYAMRTDARGRSSSITASQTWMELPGAVINSENGTISALCADPFTLFVVMAVPNYEVSVTVNPPEGGIIEGAGTYKRGTDVTLTANTSPGYDFVNWTEDGEEVSDEAQYTFAIDSDRNLQAHFALKQYDVTLSAVPEAGGVVEGDGTYNYGEEVTVTATANEGYSFVHWTEDGEEVSDEAQYTFAIDSDRNLQAHFILEQYDVTLSAVPEAGGVVEGDGTYNYGEEVTVTATANEGYNFVHWTEDGEEVSDEAQYTFTIDSDRDLQATFELLPDPSPDGQKALYVQNHSTGEVQAWVLQVDPLNPTNSQIIDRPVIGSAPAPQADWSVTAVHDIDGSGSPDLIWHNSVTGQRRVWKMSGFNKVIDLPYGKQDRPNLVVIDLHDMDGDGKPDAILQNPAGGRFIWFMDEHNKLNPHRLAFANANWNIVGVDDMDVNGKTNLIWEHKLVGSRNYWTLNEQYERIDLESGQFYFTGPAWKIVAVHDLDGDGKPDILWEHRVNGNRSMWLIDEWPPPDIEGIRRGSFAQEPVDWFIAGAGTVYE